MFSYLNTLSQAHIISQQCPALALKTEIDATALIRSQRMSNAAGNALVDQISRRRIRSIHSLLAQTSHRELLLRNALHATPSLLVGKIGIELLIHREGYSPLSVDKLWLARCRRRRR